MVSLHHENSLNQLSLISPRAKKTSRLFASRNINVTTKHSYDIAYKYVWTCTNRACETEFKRHSKSIDPARHTCGKCRSKITQTKPVPRPCGSGLQAKKSEYQVYVKEHLGRLRRENPGLEMGEVMRLVGEAYRTEKRRKANVTTTGPVGSSLDDGVEQLVEGVEIVTIEDD